MIATCDTSLLPLLLYPGVPIERSFSLNEALLTLALRWFGLKNNEGLKAGMILLKLSFFPEEVCHW